jgi:hypothetical protein
MARGRGGIRGVRQYASLNRRQQRYYDEVALPVLRRQRDQADQPYPESLSDSLRAVLGRDIGGHDVARLKSYVGVDTRDSALRRVGQRLEVRPTSGLFHPEPMSILTPDGVYEADRLTDREASVLGRYWNVARDAKRMSEAELRKALKPFRRVRIQVFDPETGRRVRMPLETDPKAFRSFATSPEASDVRIYPKRQRSMFGRAA